MEETETLFVIHDLSSDSKELDEAHQNGFEDEDSPQRLFVLYLEELPHPKTVDYNTMFLHGLQALERLAELGPYTIVVFPQGLKYSRKNLKSFYIVRPTLWTKLMMRTWGFILSPKFFKKVRWVDNLMSCPKFIRNVAKTPSLMSLEQKNPKKESLCFGVELIDLMGSKGEKGLPKLIKDVIAVIEERGLETKGLFRISPSFSAVQKARLAYNSNIEDLQLDHYPDVHVACSLLKAFLRELPSPILPKAIHSLFDDLPNSSPSDRVNKVKLEILPQITKPSSILFTRVMHLLSKVHKNASKTKMDSSNLAIILSPNFVFREPISLDNMSLNLVSQSLSGLTMFIKTCIEDFDLIFLT